MFTVKINNNSDTVFRLLNFDQTIFSISSQLSLVTDDLKTIKEVFKDIKILDIYRDSIQIATFTSFDTFKDISFENEIYDDETDQLVDVLNVTLTKANIAEQMQRLDDKVNQVVDTEKLTIDEYKDYLQEKNKAALTKFLAKNSVEFNGKSYGVGEDDQNEMALNLMQYQALTQVGQEVALEWHSKKSKCETFTPEEFLTLTAMIKTFVYPYYQQMQAIKESIFSASTKDELDKIEIEYKLIPVEQPEPITPSESIDTDESTKDSNTTDEKGTSEQE